MNKIILLLITVLFIVLPLSLQNNSKSEKNFNDNITFYDSFFTKSYFEKRNKVILNCENIKLESKLNLENLVEISVETILNKNNDILIRFYSIDTN